MFKSEFVPYFIYYNPFKEKSYKTVQSDSVTLEETRSNIIKLADRLFMGWACLFHRNIEKQIDLAGVCATVLDWATTSFFIVAKAYIFLDYFIPTGISPTKMIKFSQLLSLTSGSAFLGFGLIRGFVELANLKRTALLLKNLHKSGKTPFQKLNWIKSHYFNLRQRDIVQIKKYIDKDYANIPLHQKAEKFDAIARLILRNRFHQLESRIMPPLAKKVGIELRNVMEGLKSYNPIARYKATIKAENLIESISRQAKNKIVVHAFSLVGIAITIISMSILLSGFVCPPFFITMTCLSILFMLLSILVSKGTLDKEVDMLHKSLKEIKLPTMDSLLNLPWKKLNPLHWYNAAPSA
jgi:hypothetical protein